jgi:hypothetical protein
MRIVACSVLARTRRYHPVAAGTRSAADSRPSAQTGTSRHYLVLTREINRTQQRTLNPRVRGSSPWRRTRIDLGFYRSRLFFTCPICLHVCSMFARAHRPSNPGVVKNGPSAPDWGLRPVTAPPRSRARVPAAVSLEAASPLGTSRLQAAPGTPRRACATPCRPCRVRACQLAAFGCTRFGPRLQGSAEAAGSTRGYRQPESWGRAAQQGWMPGAGGFPGTANGRARRGFLRPGRPTSGAANGVTGIGPTG